MYECMAVKTVWYRTVMYFNFNTDSSSAENLVKDDHMYVGTRIRMWEDQAWIWGVFYYCHVEYGRMGDGSGLIRPMRPGFRSVGNARVYKNRIQAL